MRVRIDATTEGRAAMAMARGAQVPLGDAKRLLSADRVLPLDLDDAQAQALLEALTAAGVKADLVQVPRTARRCPHHPALTDDLRCEACGGAVCPLCVPRCPGCLMAERRRARFKGLRVAVLMVLLVAVAAFAISKVRRQLRRESWAKTIEVSVVLLDAEEVPDDARQRWSDGLAALDDWFAAEAARYQLPLARPFHFSLAGVKHGKAPDEPQTDSTVEALEFRQALSALSSPRGELHLVVALGAGHDGLVDGVAEAEGEVGLVRVGKTRGPLGLELIAVAHETLHCVGALDAYDANGHAVIPEGLADPGQSPRFPQRFAEVMCGEVPEGPNRGHVPASLGEVQLGPSTARQILWTHGDDVSPQREGAAAPPSAEATVGQRHAEVRLREGEAGATVGGLRGDQRPEADDDDGRPRRVPRHLVQARR